MEQNFATENLIVDQLVFCKQPDITLKEREKISKYLANYGFNSHVREKGEEGLKRLFFTHPKIFGNFDFSRGIIRGQALFLVARMVAISIH